MSSGTDYCFPILSYSVEVHVQEPLLGNQIKGKITFPLDRVRLLSITKQTFLLIQAARWERQFTNGNMKHEGMHPCSLTTNLPQLRLPQSVCI